MPRMRRRRSFRRKKRYQWLGSMPAFDFTMENSNTTAFEIAGPVAVGGLIGNNVDCVLERVILGWNLQSTDNTNPGRLDMYLAVLETSNAFQALAYIPDISDVDFFEKRDTMFWYSTLVGTLSVITGATQASAVGTSMSNAGSEGGVIINNGLPHDIKVKRRVRGQEALYLVARFAPHPESEGSPTGIFNAWGRCLFSFGRK